MHVGQQQESSTHMDGQGRTIPLGQYDHHLNEDNCKVQEGATQRQRSLDTA